MTHESGSLKHRVSAKAERIRVLLKLVEQEKVSILIQVVQSFSFSAAPIHVIGWQMFGVFVKSSLQLVNKTRHLHQLKSSIGADGTMARGAGLNRPLHPARSHISMVKPIPMAPTGAARCNSLRAYGVDDIRTNFKERGRSFLSDSYPPH